MTTGNMLLVSGAITLMTLVALSISVPFQLVSAARTLTTPGHAVTFPNEGNSDFAIAEHVGKGAPCQAFQNEHNPVTGTFSRHLTC
jgi:hypothetical protein